MSEVVAATPTISVIVPVYNGAAFLSDLMADLRTQTFQDIEILLVDDGSTDGSLEVVRRYAQADARVRCFHQENGGAGAARNLGLQHAKGRECIFLDVDDRYDPALLATLHDALTTSNADIATCLIREENKWLGTVCEDEGFDRRHFPLNRPFRARDIPHFCLRYTHGPINKLYRRSFLCSNGLWYSTTRVANDFFFALAAAISASAIVCVPKALVTVRRYVNEESISARRGEHIKDTVEVYRQLYAWMAESPYRMTFAGRVAELFRLSFHYNAQYAVDAVYQTEVCEVLRSLPPWQGRPVQRVAMMMRLDETPAHNRLREARSALAGAAAGKVQEYEAIRFQENLIENIRQTRRLLGLRENETGNKLSYWFWRLRWCVEDHGVWGTVRRLFGRGKRT